MLALLVAVALAGFAAAALLSASQVMAPAAWAHVAFAMGVMPLILGAIGYFVPVLTRSGAPPPPVRLLPVLAVAAGAFLVAALAWPGRLGHSIIAAAALALMAACCMLGWIVRRGRAALGAPHPGLRWYLAAMVLLAAALLAVIAMELWPQQRAALRLFHLHLNVLGFVGITAIGTLQVLLPTAAARPDPGVALRLRRDLPLAAAGALLVAAGAAWFKPLSYAGLILYLVPPARMAAAWIAHFRGALLQSHGAAPSLSLALLGLVLLLLAGGAHGFGLQPGRDAILGFILAFLLPLVSGAATQLLPVWLRPGVQTAWHAATRARLGRWSAPRAALMVAGGVLATSGVEAGLWGGVAGLALFIMAAASLLFLRCAAPEERTKIERRP